MLSTNNWQQPRILVLFAIFAYVIVYIIAERYSNGNIFLVPQILVESYSKIKTQTTDLFGLVTEVVGVPRIIIVLGTRPDAIKCAPLIAELKSKKYISKFDVKVISTGQHREILKQNLAAFQQTVDVDLKLMNYNQSLPVLFIGIFSRIIKQIDRLKPDLVVVQGDTTTALASAIAAAYQGVPVAHVEAGLRSFNLSNPYPEELNRKVIDSFAKLMFAPTTFAKEALLREGACETDIFVTGNTGVDALYKFYKRTNISAKIPILETINLFKRNHMNVTNTAVVLFTMHRRENFPYLPAMCEAIKAIAKLHDKNILIFLPVHPNPNVRRVVLKILYGLPNVNIVDPIPFDIFGHIIGLSDVIVTDSGGIQEEAVSIGKPVILMRSTTERPEGIYLGTIKQIGVSYREIVEGVNKMLQNSKSWKENISLNIFGDGTASKQIAIIIDNYLSGRITVPPQCTTKERQDAIARTIYPFKNMKKFNRLGDNTITSHAERKRIMQDITRVRPRITLSELLRMPSKYDISKKSDNSFTLTAIIGMYKREGVVKRWIEALISQTHPPNEIWITSFASPIADKLRAEIEEVRSIYYSPSNNCLLTCIERNCKISESITEKNSCFAACRKRCAVFPRVLFVNMGEMQLKYFGRFQLALQCHTKYIIVMDDDCIPQPRYFETAMHTINTQQYRGILGTKGTPVAESPYFGPLSKSDRIIEADVVGGSWFMQSEWVKLMFHDKMHSWNSGEDWHLCANARKYANIRSFVMPVDPNDTSTYSFSEDYLTISDKGDTTGRVTGTSESRKYIIQQLWLRGDRLMDSYTISQPNLLLFGEKSSDALMLLEYSKEQLTRLGGRMSFATSNSANNDINITRIKNECHSFHDFMIGRDYNMEPTPIIVVAEVMYAIDMVVQGTQSTAIMITGSSSTTAMLAVVTAALLRNIPIINIYIEEDIIDLKKAEAIVIMSSITFRASIKRKLHSAEIQSLNQYLNMLYS